MALLRRWWWAILLVVVIAFRIALPGIVRTQIERRASEALGATVRVGDVDLALLLGGVALEDVSLVAKDAPEGEAPLVAWKRLAVSVRWLPFIWKTVRFASIELVEPQVALDRLQSGEINLAAFVPKSEPAAEPPPEPAKEGEGWKIGVDYLGLHRGGIRFRDLFVPDAEPVSVGLDSIEIRDVSLAPDVYGTPADIKFVVKLDEGAIRTRARLTPHEKGIGLDVTLDATRLPVHRSRVYVPGMAWSDLTGALSMDLRYRLETGGRNELSGTLALDDVVVWVGGLDEPALAWKQLQVALERVDLQKHAARLEHVRLDGAVFPVRPRGPDRLPLLKATNAPPAPPPAPGAAAEPATPWSWAVGALAVDGSTVRLLSELPPLEVGVSLDAKALSGPRHDASPIRFRLSHGDGHIDVDGTLALDPFGFDGKVASGALEMSDFLDVLGIASAKVLQAGKLDSEAHVALASRAPVPGDVSVTAGTLSLDGPWVAAEDPSEFGAGFKRLVVGVDDVTVPGAFTAQVAADRPISVALGRIEMAEPYARITRTATGIALPALTGPPAAPPAAAEPAPPAPPAPAAAPKTVPQLTVGTVTLARGRVDVMDRTVKPFFWSALTPIDLTLERVRWPGPQIGGLKLHTESATKGTIDVTGALMPKSNMELRVKDLALSPFNPYVTAFSPYSISGGALFVTTKAAIDGARYDTTTDLTLTGFRLASRTGKNVILESLGIPITVALALLRDVRGNIDLTIPVAVDEHGTQVAVGAVVREALLRALVGALSSPLKLVGAVLPTGGGAASLAPAPVRFRPGLAVVDAAGETQIQQLASFIASRPGLGVTLSAPPAQADVRALREHALAAKLGPRSGVIGTLRNVGTRGRIVDALAARARGEEGPLDAEDAKTLDDWLADVPPPSADELRRLGEVRQAAVERTLRERYGIAAEQIARAQAAEAEPADEPPAVRLELGTASP